jgi:hypothetical protein
MPFYRITYREGEREREERRRGIEKEMYIGELLQLLGHRRAGVLQRAHEVRRVVLLLGRDERVRRALLPRPAGAPCENQ